MIGGVFAWLAVANEAWLESRHFWPGAVIAAMGLTTLPLRVAFRMESKASTAREAFRHYARATLATVGIILLLSTLVTFAALLVDNTIAAVLLGLAAFFMTLLAAPVVVVAVRRPHELDAALRRAGKLALALLAVIGAMTALVALKSASSRKTIVIPSNPEALLDPLQLERIPLESRTTHNADGTTTRHLRADGGDIKRTLSKLDVAAFAAIEDSRNDPAASGMISCWVPPRVRTKDSETELAKEQAMTDAVLATRKTASGRRLRVVFDFGELPS